MMSTLSMPTSHFPFAPSPNQTFYPATPTQQIRTSPISTSTKRKRSTGFNDESTSDDGDYSSEEDARSPSTTWQQPPYTRFADGRPLKRIRRDLIGGYDDASGQMHNLNAGVENNFADMRIAPGQAQPPVYSTMMPNSTFSTVHAPVPVPNEEEDEEDLHDVSMRNRTWYEPEKDRIVVFDLDDSEDESSRSGSSTPRNRKSKKTSTSTSNTPYSISQAYLDKIPAWPHRPPHDVAGLVNPPPALGALVLYKTPTLTEPFDKDDRPLYAYIEEVEDDAEGKEMAMQDDVEMMDLDDGMQP